MTAKGFHVKELISSTAGTGQNTKQVSLKTCYLFKKKVLIIFSNMNPNGESVWSVDQY
jgi:hypothetical protein